jgi:predicted dehydrogenase
MAWAGLTPTCRGPTVKLVAVADCDLNRTAEAQKRFPGMKVYRDWRELLDKEKNLDTVNVSPPTTCTPRSP